MASVINKTTLQYLDSVNTPDYSTDDWIIDPTLPECDAIYWKIVDDEVQEMTSGEKTTKDAEIAADEASAADDIKDIDNLDTLTRASILTILDEINALRTEASLDIKSVSDLRTAVKTKYDTL